MRAFSVPLGGASPRVGPSVKGRSGAQRLSGGAPLAQGLRRALPQDAVEADLILEPEPLASSSSAASSSSRPAGVPLTGRGMPPVVMCLAPADANNAGGSGISLVEPPASGFDDAAFAPPAPAPPVPPPAGEGASAGARGGGVDSSSYVREMINLSVEFASLDEEAKTRELDPATYTTEPPALAPAFSYPAEMSKERLEARELVRSINVLQYIGERHNWMIIVAPETPVAGEECIILFNRLQSEALRVRPRIQVHYAFNQWQLNRDGHNFVSDLSPAPMPKDNSDFWWARIQVPKDAFELNFVLCDAEGLYENNGGQDFMFPVIEGISRERWAEIAAEIAAKKLAERMEEERKKAEEEARVRLIKMEEEKKAREEDERKRAEEMRKQDASKGLKRAEDLARGYLDLQRKGLLRMRKGNDQADEKAEWVWLVEPSEPKAGGKATILYNRKAASLHWLQIKDDLKLSMRWGVNGWQKPQVATMERCKEVPLAAKQHVKFLEEELARAKIAAEAAAAAAAAAHAAAVAAAAADPKAKPPPPPPPPPKVPEFKAPENDWWTAEIDIPFDAVCVNFVVNFFEHYDNNGSKDYGLKVGLPENHTMEQWVTAMAETFRVQEFEARVAAEAEARRRELRRMEKRKKAFDQVLAVERRKVRHVLFTEPEIIRAGEEVTIWYNPQDTPLRGKQQVMLSCGFNRWTHTSPVGPLPMLPPDVLPTFDDDGNELTPYLMRSGSPTHWKATFVVPHDAYKMDFVFSDGVDTYDNRGGYDYHLPVEGSPVKEPSMYVVHIAVEMAPIAKVGGLGDVVTALGRAVKEQGHTVEVCLPKYEFFNYSPVLQSSLRFETEYDWGGTRIVVTTAEVENLRVWFIEPRNQFFNTPTVYGRYDDEVRFDFFCKASLEFLLRTNRQPDIIHCHDWSTAHVAKAYWEDYNPYGLWKPKVIFTVHNLNYGQKKISEAAFYCQKFTTVSPTYAFETGGTPIIYPHVHKFCGIRNGIDCDIWDPENNRFLPAPIRSEKVAEGKQAARNELRKRVNLSGWNDKLIVAVVSRLTPQKGVHLIKHAAYRTVERGGQFVLLGSAPDPKVQEEFNDLAATMGGQDAAFQFKYDEPLSHLIYAAADIVVVPSMFEPCGLTQLISMRYGAVPVVRHTGGLKDTVFDVDSDKGRAAWELYGSTDWEREGLDATNGFAFEGTDAMALDYALNRAIDAWYNDRAWFHSLQRRIMEQDWSWNRPALDYIELYFAAVKNL